MKKLEWYALYWNWNEDCLVKINVIREELINEVKKLIKHTDDYDIIKTLIKNNLMYHYWSKCEFEIVVRDFAELKPDTREQKIDVWYQLEPNLDRIVEYIIMNVAPRKCKVILNGKNKATTIE